MPEATPATTPPPAGGTPSGPAAWLKQHWSALLIYALPLLILLIMPAFTGFRGPLPNTVLSVLVFTVLALGLNVVVGSTGLLDLGYVTFMAIGAVVTCMGLMLMKTPEGYLLPFGQTGIIEGDLVFGFEGAYLIMLLVSGIVAAAFGVLRGIPTLRLTGDYYAIVTLGIAEIMYQVFKNEEWLTGGAFAIKITRAQRPILFGDTFNYASWRFYYLAIGALVLITVLVARLDRSRIGRAWAAIRLDETAARANGVNVNAYKMIAFAVSGFIGGVGGGLFSVWQGGVAVTNLDVWISILLLCALVLGGLGSVRGTLVGGVILFSLGEILRYELPILGKVPPEARFLIYGLILMIMMRFRSEGILPRRPIVTGYDAGARASRAAAPGRLYSLHGKGDA